MMKKLSSLARTQYCYLHAFPDVKISTNSNSIEIQGVKYPKNVIQTISTGDSISLDTKLHISRSVLSDITDGYHHTLFLPVYNDEDNLDLILPQISFEEEESGIFPFICRNLFKFITISDNHEKEEYLLPSKKSSSSVNVSVLESLTPRGKSTDNSDFPVYSSHLSTTKSSSNLHKSHFIQVSCSVILDNAVEIDPLAPSFYFDPESKPQPHTPSDDVLAQPSRVSVRNYIELLHLLSLAEKNVKIVVDSIKRKQSDHVDLLPMSSEREEKKSDEEEDESSRTSSSKHVSHAENPHASGISIVTLDLFLETKNYLDQTTTNGQFRCVLWNVSESGIQRKDDTFSSNPLSCSSASYISPRTSDSSRKGSSGGIHTSSPLARMSETSSSLPACGSSSSIQASLFPSIIEIVEALLSSPPAVRTSSSSLSLFSMYHLGWKICELIKEESVMSICACLRGTEEEEEEEGGRGDDYGVDKQLKDRNGEEETEKADNTANQVSMINHSLVSLALHAASRPSASVASPSPHTIGIYPCILPFNRVILQGFKQWSQMEQEEHSDCKGRDKNLDKDSIPKRDMKKERKEKDSIVDKHPSISEQRPSKSKDKPIKIQPHEVDTEHNDISIFRFKSIDEIDRVVSTVTHKGQSDSSGKTSNGDDSDAHSSSSLLMHPSQAFIASMSAVRKSTSSPVRCVGQSHLVVLREVWRERRESLREQLGILQLQVEEYLEKIQDFEAKERDREKEMLEHAALLPQLDEIRQEIGLGTTQPTTSGSSPSLSDDSFIASGVSSSSSSSSQRYGSFPSTASPSSFTSATLKQLLHRLHDAETRCAILTHKHRNKMAWLSQLRDIPVSSSPRTVINSEVNPRTIKTCLLLGDIPYSLHPGANMTGDDMGELDALDIADVVSGLLWTIEHYKWELKRIKSDRELEEERWTGEMSEMSAEIDVLKSIVKDLRASHAIETYDRTKYEGRASSLSAVNKKQSETIISLSQRCKELETTNIHLSTQLAALAARHSSEVSIYRAQAEKFHDQCNKLQNDLKILRSEKKEEAKAHFEEITRIHSTHAQSISKQRKDALVAKAKLRQEKETYEHELRCLSMTLETIENDRNDAKLLITRLQSRLEEERRGKSDLKAEMRAKEGVVGTLVDRLSRVEIIEQEEERKRKEEKGDSMIKIVELEGKLDTMSMRNLKLNSEKENLNEQLSEANDLISALKDEIKAERKEFEEKESVLLRRIADLERSDGEYEMILKALENEKDANPSRFSFTSSPPPMPLEARMEEDVTPVPNYRTIEKESTPIPYSKTVHLGS
ncbi:hypothetical protein ADUPG1_013929 [Aduncisulcus paluster]|uniref:Uncharacterized protein n=1 Tax=Aduncisulcus paluster TaxID=2918883 RepID=A0ABQ5K828_9EUKA|nr:hypothetical protein ADUPG1_013929 [Aduncisulcus paluster]